MQRFFSPCKFVIRVIEKKLREYIYIYNFFFVGPFTIENRIQAGTYGANTFESLQWYFGKLENLTRIGKMYEAFLTTLNLVCTLLNREN